MTSEFLGNPVHHWLATLLTFLLALVLSRFVIERGLGAVARRAKDVSGFLPRALEKMAGKTSRLFLYAFSFWLSTQWLTLSGQAPVVIERIAILFLLFQGSVWTLAMVDAFLETAFRKVESEPALNVLRFVTKLAVYVVFLLVALNNVGVNITALVTGLGVGGIAVALAVQNILSDLFASLTIALDKPFVPGDFVVVGAHKGTIVRVGLKTTRIRSLSGEELIFPNASLLQSQIQNFKRMQERRVAFSVGLTYETPKETLAKVPALLRSIVEARQGVRFERAHLLELAPSSLGFEVVYWVLSPEYMDYADTHQAILLDVIEKVGSLPASFAYPTQTVHVAR